VPCCLRPLRAANGNVALISFFGFRFRAVTGHCETSAGMHFVIAWLTLSVTGTCDCGKEQKLEILGTCCGWPRAIMIRGVFRGIEKSTYERRWAKSFVASFLRLCKLCDSRVVEIFRFGIGCQAVV
jgi:hypothetical protein